MNMHQTAIALAWLAWQGIMPRQKLTPAQIKHGERIAARRAINGQPNGYRPFTERELQEMQPRR